MKASKQRIYIVWCSDAVTLWKVLRSSLLFLLLQIKGAKASKSTMLAKMQTSQPQSVIMHIITTSKAVFYVYFKTGWEALVIVAYLLTRTPPRLALAKLAIYFIPAQLAIRWTLMTQTIQWLDIFLPLENQNCPPF